MNGYFKLHHGPVALAALIGLVLALVIVGRGCERIGEEKDECSRKLNQCNEMYCPERQAVTNMCTNVYGGQ